MGTSERLESLKKASKESIELMEELVDENKTLKKRLDDMTVAFNAMAQTCREHENLKLKFNDMSKNGYMVVLVDGDGMIFTEDLLAKGKAGGAEAGKLLIQELTGSLGAGSAPDVHVKVFVNMQKLGTILQVSGRVKEAKNFKEFATGFIQAKEHLYFIDVGDGKEMVDSRIRAELHWHLRNYNCLNVVLAASHDNGYVRVLNSILASATVPSQKVHLLEGSPFASEFISLPFAKHKFPNIFDPRKLELPRLPPGLPAPSRSPAAGVESSGGAHTQNSNPISYATAAATAPRATTASATMANAGPNSIRSMIITPQQKTAMSKIKGLQPPPCNDHYILGQCWKDPCHFSHAYRLTNLEIQAMRTRVGATRCEFGKSCRNDNCYRGHSCTSIRDGKCFKQNCPFLESEHPEGTFDGAGRWAH